MEDACPRYPHLPCKRTIVTPSSLHHFRGLPAVVFFLVVFGACSNVSRKDSMPRHPSSPETEPPSSRRAEPPVEIDESSSQRASCEPSTEIAQLAIYSFDPLHGRLSVGSTVDVPADGDRDLALESLLSRVNAQLTGRRIQTAGVRKEDQSEIPVRPISTVFP